MEIVMLGHMGRDEAAADRLMEHKLHIIGQWHNPGLVEKAEKTKGGFYITDSITNVELVADVVEAVQPDMFFTNFDDALAAGVVDAIKRRSVEKNLRLPLMPCPDRAASLVESDKFSLRDIIKKIDDSYNPDNFM